MRYDILERKFNHILKSGCLVNCKEENFGDAECANVLGRKIEHLTIFKVLESNTINFRNERGLLVGLDDGAKFLISKTLQEKSDLTLLSNEKISKSLESKIKLIEVY